MNYDNLQAGERIYYTGDMANIEDEGTITAVRQPTNFAPVSYDITLDDGREMRGIYYLSFEPGIGRRFWPLSEWELHQAECMVEAQRRMREILEPRTT